MTVYEFENLVALFSLGLFISSRLLLVQPKRAVDTVQVLERVAYEVIYTEMESHEEEEEQPHHTQGSGKESRGCSSFLIQSVVVASIGGCLLGYDLGVVSAALPQLKVGMYPCFVFKLCI